MEESLSEMTPQGYNWEGKEMICRAMYVTQGKSLEHIAAWFLENEGWQPRYVIVLAFSTSSADHLGRHLRV